MGKYRKKPVVVEAEIFHWGMEDGIQRYNQFIPKDANEYHHNMASANYPGYLLKYDRENDDRGFEDGQWKPIIKTKEGNLFISKGDWIITGVQGERYPCKPDIFEKSYEQV